MLIELYVSLFLIYMLTWFEQGYVCIVSFGYRFSSAYLLIEGVVSDHRTLLEPYWGGVGFITKGSLFLIPFMKILMQSCCDFSSS